MERENDWGMPERQSDVEKLRIKDRTAIYDMHDACLGVAILEIKLKIQRQLRESNYRFINIDDKFINSDNGYFKIILIILN